MANDSVSDKTNSKTATTEKPDSYHPAHNEIHTARQAAQMPVVDLNDMNTELNKKGVLPNFQISGADIVRGAVELRTLTKDRSTTLHDLSVEMNDPTGDAAGLAKQVGDYFKRVMQAAAEGAKEGQGKGVEEGRHTPDPSQEVGVHLDGNGQLASVRAKDGSLRQFRRDNNGQLNEVDNPDGSAWKGSENGSWTYYDNKGNQVLTTPYAPEARKDGTFIVTESDGSQTTIRPDGSGQEKRSDGSTVELNAHGDATEVTYQGGSKRNFTYDQDHQLVAFSDTNGKAWTKQNGQWLQPDGTPANADVTVDRAGNMSITNSGGTNEYLTNGAVLGKDTSGKVTHVHYLSGKDHDIGPNETVDANGNYTTKDKDGNSELHKTDGATVKSNKDGRVTEVDYPDGKQAKFGYDDKGNLNGMLDRDGNIWKLSKDDGWCKFNKDNLFDIKKHQDGPAQILPDGTIKMWNGADMLISTDNVTSTPDNAHSLWGVHADNPLAAINPDAVHQGNLGDCYFLAAVGAVAKENPQAIQNMIHDNGNGTYTVTFPGDPDHPVTIDEPTPSELGKYASDDNVNGMWVNVLEKAHRKYTGRETSDEGDDTGKGLELLTPKGQKVHTDQFVWLEGKGIFDWSVGSTSEGDTEKILEQAMKDHKAVVSSTQDGNFISNFVGTTNDNGGLPGPHVYTVEEYDPATKTVTLRNPWGGSGGTNGTFTMSLHDFHDHMQEMSYQS